MNLRQWLQKVSSETRTTNYEVNGEFHAVQCGFCEELMRSPYSGKEYWEHWEIVIRLFNTCRHCGTRNRVNKACERIEVDLEEESGG